MLGDKGKKNTKINKNKCETVSKRKYRKKIERMAETKERVQD